MISLEKLAFIKPKISPEDFRKNPDAVCREIDRAANHNQKAFEALLAAVRELQGGGE